MQCLKTKGLFWKIHFIGKLIYCESKSPIFDWTPCPLHANVIHMSRHVTLSSQ